MGKKPVFTGAGVAIVTPMKEDFSIDYERLGAMLEWQIQEGTDAIVICGTTGEASAMTNEEHLACIRYTVECVHGRVPVVAGAGSNDTAHAVWLAKEAAAAGADALLEVTPYYNKTSQRGLVRHFTAIADATDLPILLYNVPSRTGVNIAPATYKALSAHQNIAAVKEASGNITQIAQVAAECGDELVLYSGNDDQVVPILALGGKGVISVVSNILPGPMHEMVALFLEGKTGESLQLQLKYFELAKAMFADVNPIPVKEALRLMGRSCGPCRLPLVEMDDAGRQAVRRALQNAGLI